VERLEVLEIPRSKSVQPHRASYPLPRGDAQHQAAPEVTRGERVRLAGRLMQQVEERAGQRRVDPLVVPHPPVPEVEGRLPVDEASRRSASSAQIVRVAATGRRVEYQRDELLRRALKARAEVRAVARPHLRVSEA